MLEILAEYQGFNFATDQLRLAAIETLRDYANELGVVLKDQIDLVQWQWPRVTYRRNGTIEFSPRDIVDLGNLRNSQRRIRRSATQIDFTWGGQTGRVSDPRTGLPIVVDYAQYVLEGTSKMPGRDWIEIALEILPMEEYFRANWVGNFIGR